VSKFSSTNLVSISLTALLLFPQFAAAEPAPAKPMSGAKFQVMPVNQVTVSKKSDPTPLEQDRFRFPAQVYQHGMVVSAEPLASEVGVDILRAGGNAVDSAVATALALAVTLPRAGNLGGGGFLLVRSAPQKVEALDFRETAPAASTRDMLLDDNGNRDKLKATVGGLCVGVPGTVAGLVEAHKRYGKLPWRDVVEPARRLAAQGFSVPAWFHAEVERVDPLLGRFPESRKIFQKSVDGKPTWMPTGSVWQQADLAKTLSTIQAKGAAGFYQGEIANKISHSVVSHGGVMKPEDLANYKPVWRPCVSGEYRGYQVYSMPPPSSGGVHLIQALNVLKGYDLKASGHNSALSMHRIIETLRQVYADRSRWLGDPDFFKVPVAWLTSQAYADQIRAAIPDKKARASSAVEAGNPPTSQGSWNSPVAKSGTYESPQTTHFCVVDEKGMAVSLTYTLNFSYGSGLVADGTGVLLNNEMDDFSAAPGKPNAFGLLGGEANAIQPGKRPLSSMTPTILEKDGQLHAVVGSPGGSRIITVVLQVVLNLLDFELNAQTAVVEPRLHHQWFPDQSEFEQGFSQDSLDLLRAWGHKVVRAESLGHAMVVLRRPDGLLEGGADARRTGGAAAGY
jgi:gamma-glutamyltranspeptidase / glutathione hydrolase